MAKDKILSSEPTPKFSTNYKQIMAGRCQSAKCQRHYTITICQNEVILS